MNIGTAMNTAGNEAGPAVSRDGHWLFVSSDRPDGMGLNDIWVSTRATTTELWSAPEIVPVVSTTATEITPVLSWDARTLFFASNRTGSGGEIFFSTREKLIGKP